MNKRDLTMAVADKLDNASAAEAGRAVEATIEAISQALGRGEQVRINGFGTFRVKGRKARTGRNPRTGESIEIPAGVGVAFRASDGLKSTING